MTLRNQHFIKPFNRKSLEWNKSFTTWHENTISKRTFALVNCTIGPSSDTTWFPTWMKGILPANREKNKNILVITEQQHKMYKCTSAAAYTLTRRWHVFCICSAHHLHRETTHPEIGLSRRQTRAGQCAQSQISSYGGSSIKTHTSTIYWTKTWPGQREKRRSLTAESDLLEGAKDIKAEVNQSDGCGLFFLFIFYWQFINPLTLQRLIQGRTFRPRLSSCQETNHTQTHEDASWGHL